MQLALDSFFKQPNYHLSHNVGLPEMPFVRRPGVPLQRVLGHDVGGAVYTPVMPQGRTVLHLWNKIKVVGGGSWGVTFESRLPRLPDGQPYALKLRRVLNQDESLLFVNPISNYARDRLIRDLASDEHERLIEKLSVVYPRVVGLADRTLIRTLDDSPLRFVFVGNAFFRKGGEAMLRFAEKRGDELDVNITVVSTLAHPDYATPWVTRQYRDEVASRLDAHPRITWLPGASHDQVLRLMQESHAAVLPSLADTFGYSLAEGAVSGAMAVGSNVQALPEILGQKGRQIELEVDEVNEWVGVRGPKRVYDEAISVLAEGIARVAVEARDSPGEFDRERTMLRAHAQKMFGTDRDAALAGIYLKAGLTPPAGSANQ